MTDEDIEKIRAAVREVIAPFERRIVERLEAVEDKLEIMSGMSIRVDGTAQEVAAIRRVLDRLDVRVRRLEDQTPMMAP